MCAKELEKQSVNNPPLTVLRASERGGHLVVLGIILPITRGPSHNDCHVLCVSVGGSICGDGSGVNVLGHCIVWEIAVVVVLGKKRGGEG